MSCLKHTLKIFFIYLQYILLVGFLCNDNCKTKTFAPVNCYLHQNVNSVSVFVLIIARTDCIRQCRRQIDDIEDYPDEVNYSSILDLISIIMSKL